MTTLVVGPFYLSAGLSLDARRVGLVMSCGPLVSALMGLPAGRLVDRFGPLSMVLLGLSGMLTGSVLLCSSGFAGIAGYVFPLVVLTAGYALLQAANNTAHMTAVNPAQRCPFRFAGIVPQPWPDHGCIADGRGVCGGGCTAQAGQPCSRSHHRHAGHFWVGCLSVGCGPCSGCFWSEGRQKVFQNAGFPQSEVCLFPSELLLEVPRGHLAAPDGTRVLSFRMDFCLHWAIWTRQIVSRPDCHLNSRSDIMDE
ncbi:MFS transporter [Deinococcus roseus]|uniref:MFS transporter n=1 Tax=Deinococcus roseus TaxID=392414 RepID=UPI0035713CE3